MVGVNPLFGGVLSLAAGVVVATVIRKKPAGKKHLHPSPDEVPLGEWTTADVVAFLDSLELPQYARAFKDASVDGRVLATLSAVELADLGVHSSFHQKKIILHVVSLLRDGQTSPLSPYRSRRGGGSRQGSRPASRAASRAGPPGPHARASRGDYGSVAAGPLSRSEGGSSDSDFGDGGGASPRLRSRPATAAGGGQPGSGRFGSNPFSSAASDAGSSREVGGLLDRARRAANTLQQRDANLKQAIAAAGKHVAESQRAASQSPREESAPPAALSSSSTASAVAATAAAAEQSAAAAAPQQAQQAAPSFAPTTVLRPLRTTSRTTSGGGGGGSAGGTPLSPAPALVSAAPPQPAQPPQPQPQQQPPTPPAETPAPADPLAAVPLRKSAAGKSRVAPAATASAAAAAPPPPPPVQAAQQHQHHHTPLPTLEESPHRPQPAAPPAEKQEAAPAPAQPPQPQQPAAAAPAPKPAAPAKEGPPANGNTAPAAAPAPPPTQQPKQPEPQQQQQAAKPLEKQAGETEQPTRDTSYRGFLAQPAPVPEQQLEPLLFTHHLPPQQPGALRLVNALGPQIPAIAPGGTRLEKTPRSASGGALAAAAGGGGGGAGGGDGTGQESRAVELLAQLQRDEEEMQEQRRRQAAEDAAAAAGVGGGGHKRNLSGGAGASSSANPSPTGGGLTGFLGRRVSGGTTPRDQPPPAAKPGNSPPLPPRATGALSPRGEKEQPQQQSQQPPPPKRTPSQGGASAAAENVTRGAALLSAAVAQRNGPLPSAAGTVLPPASIEVIEEAVVRVAQPLLAGSLSVRAAKVATGNADRSVCVHAADGTSEPHDLLGHNNEVKALATLGGGCLLSGSRDRSLRLWHPDRGCARVLTGHSNTVFAVAPLGAGRFASAGADMTVRVWSLQLALSADKQQAAGEPSADAAAAAASAAACERVMRGHTNLVLSLCSSRGGALLCSGSSDRTVRVWDPATGAALGTLEGHTGWVNALCSLPDGWVVSASHDGTLRVWVDSGEPLSASACPLRDGGAAMIGHRGAVLAVCWAGGDFVVSGGEDGCLKLWALASASCLRSVAAAHSGAVRAVAALGGRAVASGGDDRVLKLWRVAADGSRLDLEGEEEHVHDSIYAIAAVLG